MGSSSLESFDRERMTSDLTLERLEDQIGWYDSKSRYQQQMFKGLKIATLACAAVVPLAAGIQAPALATGILGVAVVMIEAVQQLNQYHHNWIAYRATCEALKHEKYLFLATAGPYAAADAHALLAERVESLVSREHAKWIAVQEQAGKDQSTKRQ